ncbi:MAG: DMT family transporter [Verrucomicrobia bacterium]|nr:DMT family transporter [Verrucomicrobiota bacterium]
MEMSQPEPAVSEVLGRALPATKHQRGLSIPTVFALGITILFWASAFVGIRAALTGYSPTHLALLRYLIASLALVIYAAIKRMPLPAWRDLPALTFTGLVGIAVYNVALNKGEISTSAGVSSFLVNTAPIITALLATAFLRERLRVSGWLGILVCFTGVAVIAFNTGDQIRLSAGALYVLLAALAQSLYFVSQKPYLARYSALQCTSYAVWSGTLALLIFAPGLARDLQTASPSATIAAGYLGIFPAALGYVTWAYTLAHIPAARAASFLYVVPAVTLGIAWIWLGEWPTWLALLGGTIAISGVVIVNLFGKNPTTQRLGKKNIPDRT